MSSTIQAGDLDAAKAQRDLDAFLVDNDELEALSARLGAFNMFRVLRTERVEIRHSNVLAWLLTPGETHGLGASFLRRFLSRLLMANENVEVSLTPAKVELMNFGDVELLREWQNIDILAHSRASRWCLLIENKIDSKEKPGALQKYLDAVKKAMPDVEVIPVFLTIEGEEPSEDGKLGGYVSLSHAQVLEVAERIVEQNRRRIPNAAAAFIDHYLDVLRRMTMQDTELVELCRAIYQKHRAAIDLIVEYGASSQVLDAVADAVQRNVASEFIHRTGRMVWFLPREMAGYLPAVELVGWKFLPRAVPVMCWFAYHKKVGKLQVVMEVGPMADGDLRKRLLRAAQDAGFSFQKGGLADGAKFTRIVSKNQKLRLNENGVPDDDPEYIHSLTSKLWSALWDDGSRIVDVVKGSDWKADSAA